MMHRSLLHKQLRNLTVRSLWRQPCSLLHKQLRNGNPWVYFSCSSSLLHKQLRNRPPHNVLTIFRFTAA